MKEPRQIDTVVNPDESGSEVVSVFGGCDHEPHCYRRRPQGETLEVCAYLSYRLDWIKPGGVQEYCSREAKDADDQA